MQQAAQPTDQPLLTDEESEKLTELLLARSQNPGSPRNSEGKPLLTQEMVSNAMREVLQERYEKKFQQLEKQFIKPLQLAMERKNREQNQPQDLSTGTTQAWQSIDAINTAVAKLTIAGWFIGLAYFNWFASDGRHLSLWEHAALIVGGLFGSSILIGGGIAFLAGVTTKVFTGRWDGSTLGISLSGYVSPVLAFFAVKYVLDMVG
jgi:hypothetical protein